MNDRTKELLQRSKQATARTEATLRRTAPKATLGGIRQAAEKKFGQRKPTKKQNQPKPKKTQPKRPKAVSSDRLDQWRKAMEKANIPRHRWRKLEDKISRLSGTQRQEIEEELFEHDLFKDVYEAGEEKENRDLVDDYLTDLEEKLDELTTENPMDIASMVEDVNEFMQKNPALGAVAVKYVIGGNTMEFKVHETDNGVVFEDENGGLIAGFDSTELNSVEMSLLEDIYTVVQDESKWTPIEPLSPEEFRKLLEEVNQD